MTVIEEGEVSDRIKTRLSIAFLIAFLCWGALAEVKAGSSGGGSNLAAASAITFTTGLGDIAQITGPSDQGLEIKSNSSNGLQLNAAVTGGDITFSPPDGKAILSATSDGGNRRVNLYNSDPAVSWEFDGDSWNILTGLGAVNHIVGPSDQPLVVTAGAARGLTLGAASGQTLSLATGNVSIGDTVTSYGGTATAGRGLAHIVAYGSSAGVDGTTIATYTTGGAAEAFEVGGSLICTAISSGSVEIELTYTAGGTVRTHDAFGTVITTATINSMTSIGGPGDLKLYTLAIAADAATAVTWKVSRSGTNTATWYGWIKRVN